MIKFALRRNLIYPLQLIIWNLVRKLETMLISYLFKFNDLIYTPLMFIGEFLSGLLIYFYQKRFIKNKNNKPSKFFSITLIQGVNNDIISPDNTIKMHLLIGFVAFFDFIQFMIWTVTVPKYLYISDSIVSRLSGILTISDALFYYYVLRLTIAKHQLFSLIIIGISLVIVIISEFLFQHINIFLQYSDFIFMLLLTFLCEVLGALIDSIEKYLFEYDFLNPFYVLMLEGFFGFFMSFLYFLIPGYWEDIKHIFGTLSANDLTIFIFLLILYIILCGGRNVFRVVTTKIYSPMARALTDYFLNPLYLTYDFCVKQDFITENERNIPYFILNLILSIIISFCGCVYNEFMILFFCGLEHDTHSQISKRCPKELYSLVNGGAESSDDDSNV